MPSRHAWLTTLLAAACTPPQAPPLLHPGDVVVASEADARALCRRWEGVDGDLAVRADALPSGDLGELRCLRVVTGDLVLHAERPATTQGLSALEMVGGALRVQEAPIEVRLDALRVVGAVYAGSRVPSVHLPALPALERFDGFGVASLRMPRLSQVHRLSLRAGGADLDLSALVHAHRIELDSVSTPDLSGLRRLREVDRLEVVTVHAGHSLGGLDALEHVGVLSVDHLQAGPPTFAYPPALRTARAVTVVFTDAPTAIDTAAALERVDDGLLLYARLPGDTAHADPYPSLTYAGTVEDHTLSPDDAVRLQARLDDPEATPEVAHVDGAGADLSGLCAGGGRRTLHGSLAVVTGGPLSDLSCVTAIRGSLWLARSGPIEALAQLERVEGSLLIEAADLDSLRSLREVGGDLVLRSSTGALPGLATVHGRVVVDSADARALAALREAGDLELRSGADLTALSSLTHLHGDLLLDRAPQEPLHIELPAVQHVGGDVLLPSTVAHSFALPALRTVGGLLHLAPDRDAPPVLGGLPSLRSVGELHLRGLSDPTLDGLGELRRVGGLLLLELHADAVSLEPLHGLEWVGGDVQIDGPVLWPDLEALAEALDGRIGGRVR